MDGRVQLPVINYVQERFDAEYVDTITEPGPNRILAEQNDEVVIASILKRLDISLEKHSSVGVAVVGHHDCAGNPTSQEAQIAHIRKAVRFLRQRYANTEIVGLWVDENWQVHEVEVKQLG